MGAPHITIRDIDGWHAEQCFIATARYNDVGYKNLGYVKNPTREDLMQTALKLWKNGDVGLQYERSAAGY